MKSVIPFHIADNTPPWSRRAFSCITCRYKMCNRQAIKKSRVVTELSFYFRNALIHICEQRVMMFHPLYSINLNLLHVLGWGISILFVQEDHSLLHATHTSMPAFSSHGGRGADVGAYGGKDGGGDSMMYRSGTNVYTSPTVTSVGTMKRQIRVVLLVLLIIIF